MLKKLLALLNPSERKQAILIMCMILIMAFLDMLGVASILPFITVLTNPELVQTNAALNTVFKLGGKFGIQTVDQFLYILGALVFVLLITSLSFKALTLYVQSRFLLMREYSIGKRLIENYLHQPYIWFLNRHSADLSKNILIETRDVIDYGLTPLMTLITQLAVTLTLMFLLLAVDILLSLSIGISLGIAYYIIFMIVSARLRILGESRIEANQERFTVVSEAFGSTKEMKVSGLEQIYISRFEKPAKIYAKGEAAAKIIAQLPRFALEAIAFGGILLLILFIMNRSGSFTNALPIIALYVFAGYRLMPALQQIYSSFTRLRFTGPLLDKLYKDISDLQIKTIKQNGTNYLKLNKVITLNNISFQYPGANQLALKNIDITIPAHSTVGFVGATGSGKTTLIDIILGILEPNKGNLDIDGQSLGIVNRREWQRNIGYVPQNIYLVDNTIGCNIAFGLKTADIDQKALERAAKIANIHEFVTKQLPQGYNTLVGEHGVRLSGGQRQRIVIARALYHNPQILILDEATSALDSLTEKAVIDALNNIENNKTIILIAHRLSTIQKCDKIFLIEKGEVKASGSYDKLINDSDQFAAMVKSKNF